MPWISVRWADGRALVVISEIRGPMQLLSVLWSQGPHAWFEPLLSPFWNLWYFCTFSFALCPANYIAGSWSCRRVKIMYKNETRKTALIPRAFVLRGWNMGASEYRWAYLAAVPRRDLEELSPTLLHGLYRGPLSYSVIETAEFSLPHVMSHTHTTAHLFLPINLLLREIWVSLTP